MKDLQLMMLRNIPRKCSKCEGELVLVKEGSYQCRKCEHIMLDDYETLLRYMEENAPANEKELSDGTGINMGKIRSFIQGGYIERSVFYRNDPEKIKLIKELEKAQIGSRNTRFHNILK